MKKRKVKILFITKHFLPESGGGLRRIEALYRIMQKREDIELTVITASYPRGNKYPNVKHVRQLFFADNNGRKPVEFRKTKSRIKLIDKALVGWLPNVLARILFCKYDFVYATCPVFTNVIIGFLYKMLRFGGPKLLIEYRDLHGFNPSFENDFNKKAAVWLEKFIIKKADRIVVTTEGMKERLSGYAGDRITVIRNYAGLDDVLKTKGMKKIRLDGKHFNIGYTGRLNTGRDPVKFIMNAGKRINDKRIAFHFVGINETEENHLREIIGERHLDERLFFFYRQVSRAESLRFMKSFDGLLVIINNDAKISEGYGIPGKLYDYAIFGDKMFTDRETLEKLSSEFAIRKLKTSGSLINFKIDITENLDGLFNRFIDGMLNERK